MQILLLTSCFYKFQKPLSFPCICLVLKKFLLWLKFEEKMVTGEKFALSSFLSLNCSTCQPPKPQGLQAASSHHAPLSGNQQAAWPPRSAKKSFQYLSMLNLHQCLIQRMRAMFGLFCATAGDMTAQTGR